MKQFFNSIADILAKKTKCPVRTLNSLFLKRERESTTVLHPGLAIPHIIIPGRKKFIIIPVRCLKGISFPGTIFSGFLSLSRTLRRTFSMIPLNSMKLQLSQKYVQPLYLALVGKRVPSVAMILYERKPKSSAICTRTWRIWL